MPYEKESSWLDNTLEPLDHSRLSGHANGPFWPHSKIPIKYGDKFAIIHPQYENDETYALPLSIDSRPSSRNASHTILPSQKKNEKSVTSTGHLPLQSSSNMTHMSVPPQTTHLLSKGPGARQSNKDPLSKPAAHHALKLRNQGLLMTKMSSNSFPRR